MTAKEPKPVKEPKPRKIRQPVRLRLSICLPKQADMKEVNAALAKIAKANGWFSNNAPKIGSVGHMLFALATGRAMIVNLEPKEE